MGGLQYGSFVLKKLPKMTGGGLNRRITGLENQGEDGLTAERRARVRRPQTRSSFPVIFLLAVPRLLSCFASLVILDVVCRYLSLFLFYINIKIGKNRC